MDNLTMTELIMLAQLFFPLAKVTPSVLKEVKEFIERVNSNFYDKKNVFLDYNMDTLANIYLCNKVAQTVPYEEIINWGDLATDAINNLRVIVSNGSFRRNIGSNVWVNLSDQGFRALVNAGKVKQNEPMIRLSKISDDGLTLTVQQACYHDQARSNLILDYHPNSLDKSELTLRKILLDEYSNNLPPLEDDRLANTVGIAALLYYWDKKTWVPYLVQRADEVGVFPGGLHCTASGAANWPIKYEENDFNAFFTENMHAELLEEVGINKDDVVDLKPISLCRELVRAGKPQIFFAGVTSLNRRELKKRSEIAIKKVKESGGTVEIKKRKLGTQNIVLKGSDITSNLIKYGATIEGLAAYYYGAQYLKNNKDLLESIALKL